MLYSTKSLILFTDVTVLWMVLKTFITENTGYALILIAIILGTVELYRIPQLPDEKISDNILKLFKFDSKDLKKNVIFHKGGAGHAPENTIEAVQKVRTSLWITFSKGFIVVVFIIEDINAAKTQGVQGIIKSLWTTS